MKIIELLNKIANGEEVPKRIKTKNDIWTYDGIDYRASDDGGYMFEVHTSIDKDDLNEEIEIIEEDKKIEKIMGIDTRETRECIIKFQDKINEIIEVINERTI